MSGAHRRRPRALRRALPLLALAAPLLGGACASSRAGRIDPIPGKRVEARNGMVAASHPDAAAAGLAMLRRGGNAVDAAVAAAFALSVVDPSQTGLGGGGSATLWNRRARRAVSMDFMAMAGADSAWAVLPGGTPPLERRGRSAAVPGTVAGLLDLLERHGTLAREVVMAPAIALARDGFVVSPLLARTIASSAAKLGADSLAAARFMPGGQGLQAGDRLVQPELAATLERVARGGNPAFYDGEIADRLAAKVRATGGLVTPADVRAYRAVERRPLCFRALGHTVLSAPPPLAGATVLQALGLFERATPRQRDDVRLAESPATALRLADALRVAGADRGRWLGDPDVLAVPARGLASGAYAAERLPLVGAGRDQVPPGDPWDEEAQPLEPACAALDAYPATARPREATSESAPAATPPAAEAESFTSHLSVVDAERNAVSMTFTVGVLFGSGVYTDGFFLSSSGTNFNARTAGPNRRNNSTMSPTILLDGDDVRLVVGAAGSQYIPPAIVQTVVQVVGYGMDVGDALAAPRLAPRQGRDVEIEPGWSPAVFAAFREAGWVTQSRTGDLLFGGVHAVQVRRDGRLVGAADPRRDGVAAGH